MRALICVAMLALSWFPMDAFAQGQPAAAPQFGPACAADIQKFCPNLPPGPDRHRCVVANMASMSRACQTAFNALRASMAGFRQVCGADIQRYCTGATAEPARGQCIAQNQQKFSQGCQAAIAQNPSFAK